MSVENSQLLEKIRTLLDDTLKFADSIGEHLIAANVSTALAVTIERLERNRN
ncbi:hypothetical protein [Sphingomonas sp. R86521]|uniref:hypothetical protein n=1 Tax=Sphingomonas sp. R86521 TaxID=3093860 RepID=UPI0036D28A91